MEIKLLDLWNGIPVGLPKYLGFLPYILWIESDTAGCLYIGFLNFAIAIIINRL